MDNKHDSGSRLGVLKLLRKSVYKQAILAALLILLTVVVLFAITTAWYTNIVQTSGLMFEAAAWGFDGQIAVSEEAIKAAPGDEGSVYLTLENDSESLVDVSVYVDKTTMGENMQKRLYFYVETSEVINGELVDRVYLSKGNGYDYTVMGLGNLTLTEAYHNDAPIKWEWTYDVLGYYVLGTLEAAQDYTTLDGNVALFEASTVHEEEYLRPIEYQYDEALTTFTPNEDGVLELATIDGTTTVAQFLQQVTSSDGYYGTVNENTVRTKDGYYPVSVDATTGYGVWLYLCNYSEIESAIIWDTQQGENAASSESTAQFKAVLNISAQKSDVETTVVRTQTELANALSSTDAADTNQVIQLSSDTYLNYVEIPEGKNVVLDLNGNTLSATDSVAMQISEGSSVTVLNGTLTGVGTENSAAFNVTGAELTLSGVTSTGVGRLVNLLDNTGTGADSRIRLLDCNIDAVESAVYVVGNGLQSDNPTQVVVEDSVIYGGYAGIICNGSTGGTGNWGTDITIINSSVSGYWTGIYHPQKDSTLSIIGSTIEGYTGLALKGGYITINNSTVHGTGAAGAPGYAASGWTDTGDGVYVECNYEWDTVVDITSSIVTSDYAEAVRKYMADAANASVIVYSGTYNSDVSAYLAANSQITFDGSNYIVSGNTQ